MKYAGDSPARALAGGRGMCHQWLSIAGLAFDIVGFLLIAFEWHLMFKREMHERLQQTVEVFEKYKAHWTGDQYEEPYLEDHTIWRELQKLQAKDKRVRQKLFYPGVVLVVLGFLFQVLGSWPWGLTSLGLRACLGNGQPSPPQLPSPPSYESLRLLLFEERHGATGGGTRPPTVGLAFCS